MVLRNAPARKIIGFVVYLITGYYYRKTVCFFPFVNIVGQLFYNKPFSFEKCGRSIYQIAGFTFRTPYLAFYISLILRIGFFVFENIRRTINFTRLIREPQNFYF